MSIFRAKINGQKQKLLCIAEGVFVCVYIIYISLVCVDKEMLREIKGGYFVWFVFVWRVGT